MIKLNRQSEAYYCMVAAGFKPKELRVITDHPVGPIVVFEWLCVCGRVEMYSLTLDVIERMSRNGLWDAARHVQQLGSFSREHLEQDGFAEEDIKRIRFVYDILEENWRLRPFRQMHEQGRVL